LLQSTVADAMGGSSGKVAHAVGVAENTGYLTKEGRLHAACHRQLHAHPDKHVEWELDANDHYVFALLTIAGADGFSKRELRWLEERAIMSGVPSSHIEKYRSFNFSKGDADMHLERCGGESVKRAMMYDAITMCSQDGYTETERRRALQVAEKLDMDEDVFNNIEDICATEREMFNKKRAILWANAYTPPLPSRRAHH